MATSEAVSGKRPSLNPVGAPGWPGSNPNTCRSSVPSLSAAEVVSTEIGPAPVTPSTAATCATTSGCRREACRLSRAVSEYTSTVASTPCSAPVMELTSALDSVVSSSTRNTSSDTAPASRPKRSLDRRISVRARFTAASGCGRYRTALPSK